MKCVIPGGHVKVFGKAIHSLSRIGDELWFDPLEKGLALRVVNAARSAYACVLLSSFFFHDYHIASIQEQGQGNVILQLRCKLSIKAVLPVFRSLIMLERNVEKCSIYTNFTNCRLVFRLFCKHGITKTHKLYYEDCEPLEAAFSANACPNVLKMHSRIFSDAIIHFPTCQDEVTLTITPLKVTLKSFNEEAEGFPKRMHTEIHLGRDEFLYFKAGVDSEVTFCLKELRGCLAFAETISACISVHFGQPGKPIAFSIDDMMFEANFILATLDQSESGTSTQTSQRMIVESKRGTPFSGSGNENIKKSMEMKQISKQQPVFSASPAMSNILQNAPEQAPREPARHSSYNKFCSLFFGAITSQQDDFNQVFHSLATASEDEEEEGCGRKQSQTF
ncbi:cell cycle checkpoint control protein RAD9B [Spea bombifrons]|uniref:cell cycle checkpoint control protein RAD9B n=1 Tax=Spea bombifrons TaxID=233779 RepID=UPI00234AF187|nr:cell cycle checkpoint control protein RAD9B [Spea bombifrons]